MKLSDRIKEKVISLHHAVCDSEINVSDDVLFSEACSFVRGELMDENRNNYKKPFSDGNSNKATAKQRAFIQKLADKKGVDITISDDLTSKEASLMIKELGGNK